MTEQALRKMIAAGESTRQEFKSWVKCKDYRQRKELAVKSAVALANTKGGVLLFGVEDDGTITGCPKSDPQALMEAIYDMTRPSLFTDKELDAMFAQNRIAENKQSPQAGYKIRSVGFTISGVIFLCVAGRDEGLLELNGKTYMLSLKVYETVKTDVAYVQDKTVSQIQAKDRILEYLKHKPSITNQKAQELCGYTKDQAYRILRKLVEEGKIEVKGAGRGRRYCLKENQR